MVAALFSFSQILTEQEEEEEGGKTPEERESRERFEMQIFVVWLKASLGNIWPGFRCVELV